MTIVSYPKVVIRNLIQYFKSDLHIRRLVPSIFNYICYVTKDYKLGDSPQSSYIQSKRLEIEMTRSERKTDIHIKRELNAFIRDKFLSGDKDFVLNDHDSFLEKGLIDSTGVLELVDYIEETFAIKIDDEELIPDNLDSLDKITNFITRKIGYVSQ